MIKTAAWTGIASNLFSVAQESSVRFGQQKTVRSFNRLLKDCQSLEEECLFNSAICDKTFSVTVHLLLTLPFSLSLSLSLLVFSLSLSIVCSINMVVGGRFYPWLSFNHSHL